MTDQPSGRSPGAAPREAPADMTSPAPVLQYEGHVRYAASERISLQCFEGRCSECPDESPAGQEGSSDVLDGYACEHWCPHGPAAAREAPEPASSAALDDAAAVEIIAEWLRDPDWNSAMLEDIADTIRRTGRQVQDYPDGRPTWARH